MPRSSKREFAMPAAMAIPSTAEIAKPDPASIKVRPVWYQRSWVRTKRAAIADGAGSSQGGISNARTTNSHRSTTDTRTTTGGPTRARTAEGVRGMNGFRNSGLQRPAGQSNVLDELHRLANLGTTRSRQIDGHHGLDSSRMR